QWCKPELVAEIKFAEWTPGGHLRSPVFVRLRDDVDPRGVRRTTSQRALDPVSTLPSDALIAEVLRQLEDKRNTLKLAIGSDTLQVTNLDRVYWPADPALHQPK